MPTEQPDSAPATATEASASEPKAPAVAEAPAGAPSMFYEGLRGGGQPEVTKRVADDPPARGLR